MARVAALPGLRLFKKARFRFLVALILLAGAGVRMGTLLVDSFQNLSDFRLVFLLTSRLGWSGSSPYSGLHSPTPGNLPVIDTPTFAMAMWPWTVMPDDLARISWLLLLLLALALTLLLVYRELRPVSMAEVFVGIALVILFRPLADALHEGQVGLLLGLAMVLAFIQHLRGRSVLGGAILGVAIAAKLTPAIALLYFAWKRDWKLCGAAVSAAVLVSALTLGFGWASYWPPFLGELAAVSQGTAFVDNQSLNGLLLRAWHPELSSEPIPFPGWDFRLVWLATQVAVLAVFFGLARRMKLRAPISDWVAFAVLLLVAPVLQPFAWTHHYVQAVVVIPVVVYLATRRMLTGGATLVLVGAYVASTALEFAVILAARQHPGADLASHPGLLWAASILVYCSLAGMVALTATTRPGPGGTPARTRPRSCLTPGP
jgi:alpha-1,2-mannosyltransferase